MLLCTPAAAQEAPSDLPTPQWTSTEAPFFLQLPKAPATVQARFTPVPGAARYQVILTDDEGRPVTDRAVDKDARRVTFDNLSPGQYRATVFAIDAAGRPTEPSDALSITVAALTVPQGATGLLDDRAAPTALPGATFLAPPGSLCAAPEMAFGPRVVLFRPGENLIVCKPQEGLAVGKVAVQVLPITVTRRGDEPLFPGGRHTVTLDVKSPVAVDLHTLDVLGPPGVTLARRAPDGNPTLVLDVALSETTFDDVALLIERQGAPVADILLRVRHDTTPPSIANVGVVGGGAEGEVTVTAQVVDDTGVGRVQVAYRFSSSGPFEHRPMHVLAAPTYAVDIVPPAEVAAIEYYVEASDIGDNGPTRVGTRDTPLHHALGPPPAPPAPWWTYVPLGISAAGVVAFVGLGAGLLGTAYWSQNARLQVDAGTLSPAEHEALQARLMVLAIAEAAGLLVAGTVAALGGVGTVGLYLLDE